MKPVSTYDTETLIYIRSFYWFGINAPKGARSGYPKKVKAPPIQRRRWHDVWTDLQGVKAKFYGINELSSIYCRFVLSLKNKHSICSVNWYPFMIIDEINYEYYNIESCLLWRCHARF